MNLLFSSAVHLAAAIRARRVSAMEVLEAHLAQIEKQNPQLNAVVTLDAERAREWARDADRALLRGEAWGPLHGVPFTLKVAFATAGMRTTLGCEPMAHHVPRQESTVATAGSADRCGAPARGTAPQRPHHELGRTDGADSRGPGAALFDHRRPGRH